MNANHTTKKIEMTKTEAKTAGKPNTDEYNTLLDEELPRLRDRDCEARFQED